MKLTIVFADDNWAAIHGNFTGTNKGSYVWKRAANNKVRVPITVLFELKWKR